MHIAIGSLNPFYGHSLELKPVSVSAITVLVIFHCRISNMGFVLRNTRSLTDQVKSPFWLVSLAYRGLQAIGKGAIFNTGSSGDKRFRLYYYFGAK